MQDDPLSYRITINDTDAKFMNQANDGLATKCPPVTYDLWIPGCDVVISFDRTGAPLAPYEFEKDITKRLAMGHQHRPETDYGAPHINVYVNGTGYTFPVSRPTGFALRMYVCSPDPVDHEIMIPQHVADCTLPVSEMGRLFSLHATSDNTWITPRAHAWAVITKVAGSSSRDVFLEITGGDMFEGKSYDHWLPVRNGQWDALCDIFEQVTRPDVSWMENAKSFAHPSLAHILISPPCQALAGGPIIRRPNKDDIVNNMDSLCMNIGTTAASAWRLGRGTPATDEWFEERLIETFALHDSVPRQFIDFVRTFVVRTDTMNYTVDNNMLVTWVDDVVRAMGAHASSQRYVRDHRWTVEKGELEYENVTDDNTTSFTIPGDCEDNNSTVYYLLMHLIQNTYVPGSLLWCARACAILAGVPICVVGSSMAPVHASQVHDGPRGSHLFGYVVPMRNWARHVWGSTSDEVDVESVRLLNMGNNSVHRYTFQPDALRKVEVSAIETTVFATPNAIKDAHEHMDERKLALFAAYMEFANEQNEPTVFSRRFGAEYPLEENGAHGEGYVIHDRVIRAFTAAIPVMFSREFRERNKDKAFMINQSSPIGDGPLTKRIPIGAPESTKFVPGGESSDPFLDRTFGFVFTDGIYVGVPSADLLNGAESLRIISLTRVSQAIADAEMGLLAYDRPFVPLVPSLNARDRCDRLQGMLHRLGLKAPTPDYVPKTSDQQFVVYVYADVIDKDIPANADIEHLFGDIKMTLGHGLHDPRYWATQDTGRIVYQMFMLGRALRARQVNIKPWANAVAVEFII